MEYDKHPLSLSTATARINSLINNIELVIKGKRLQIELVLTTLFAKGHILIEDNPGTGKTIMAKTLAKSIAGNEGEDAALYKRIQFTPDLLPMDLLGSYIFNEQNKDFIFKKGPLFSNILLADEINRASPKVQSALLESMAEHQVTVGDTTFPLARMFFTIATQNPVEMEGTYPLPAAQLDRFFMKIYFGYVDEETELGIYNNYLNLENFQTNLPRILSLSDVLELQHFAQKIYIHPEIVKSVRNIVVATRQNKDIILGASTRSGIILIKCLKAYALIRGREYVTEDDLQQITGPVLQHRILFRNKEVAKNGADKFLEAELDRLGKMAIN